MGKNKDTTFDIPPDQMAELLQLALESESYAKCIASADSQEERGSWRQALVVSQMAYHRKMEELCLKYGEKELPAKRLLPIMDYWNNRIVLKETD